MRICSLLPSATEIVADLGLADSLVAVSEECDWPPEVRRLPVVTASRVDTTRSSSLEIDKAVREAVGDGRPLYAIDRALLEALQPDLILTQNLCAVCAVAAEMEAKIAAVRRRLGDAPTRSVFVAEWLDPPYAAGHWIPEMVAIAGGRDVLGQAGAPSYPTSWETV